MKKVYNTSFFDSFTSSETNSDNANKFLMKVRKYSINTLYYWLFPYILYRIQIRI